MFSSLKDKISLAPVSELKIVATILIFCSAILTFLPNNTLAQSSICSKDLDGRKVKLEIANATGKPFFVNFVDQNCRESRSNQKVEPNGIFKGESYNGHAFRVREFGTNKLIREIVADPANPITIVYTSPSNAEVAQSSNPSPPVRSSGQPSNNTTAQRPVPPAPTAVAPARGQAPPVGATKFPMSTGTVLTKGTKYLSPSGNHYLIFASDGNLIVRQKDEGFIWGLNEISKNYNKSERVEFGRDGSFGAYDTKGGSIWSPPAKRDPNAKLNLTFGGALQMVAGNGEVLWSSDGVLAATINVFTIKPNVKPCTPEAGWAKCVELMSPAIKIMGSRAVSQSGMNGVANIYTEITKRFGANYPKSKFDGFKVYLTNGEPWSELRKLSAIAVRPEQPYETSDDFYRGFGGHNSLWITEQMICKQGVKTRNATGKIKDNSVRTLDQVVHEFGHSIDSQFIPDQTMNIFTGNGTPVESFAARIQNWFGAPGSSIPANQEAVLKGLFTSRATFSCEGYKP